MRTGLLAYLTDRLGLEPEPTATLALAYILGSSSNAAREFVNKVILDDDIASFEIGKIKPETQISIGKVPDLTIEDRNGKVRAFIENKFWAELTPAQPVDYINALPTDLQAYLVFVVPERRMREVWQKLTRRCSESGMELGQENEYPGGTQARILRSRRTIGITSWGRILDIMDQAAAAAGNAALRQDIGELRGLALWQESEGVVDDWTEISLEHAVDRYTELTKEIIAKIQHHPRIDIKGLTWAKSPFWKGRYFRVDDYGFGLGLAETLWRRSGMTPISCRVPDTEWGGLHNRDWSGVESLFASDGAEFADDSLFIPIRIQTGVGRDRVVEEVLDQVLKIADRLNVAFRDTSLSK